MTPRRGAQARKGGRRSAQVRGGRWARLRQSLGARLTLGRIALAAALIGALLAAAALRDDDREEPGVAPPDHATHLVPGEALVYTHGTLERDSSQWERANRLFRRIRGLTRLRDRAASALTPGGGAIDLAGEVEPWVGDEAALALLPGRGAARSLILVEVADRELALAFLRRAVGKVRTTTRRGVKIRLHGRLATTFLDDFLLVGRLGNVRRAIDVREHPSLSLEQDPAFRRARRHLPRGERIAYAYASPEGVRDLLGRRRDLLGELMKLVDDDALEGAAASVQLAERGARVFLASALRPRRNARARRVPAFTPKLPEVIPGDAVAYLGMRGADRVLEVATDAGGGRLPLLDTLARLESDLEEGGLRLRRSLRPLLRKEAALFVTGAGATPALTLVADRVRGQEFQGVLDRLQPLFSGSLGDLSAGVVPTLEPRRIAGVNAATIRITPTLALTYAVFGGRAVVSTGARGIESLRRGGSPIGENPLLSAVLDGNDRVTSVVFLDLRRLLAIGEQADLGQAPSYRALSSDLSGIGAVSAITREKAASKTAKIFIEVQ
jgi:Protein of unknown function (DUF3352)